MSVRKQARLFSIYLTVPATESSFNSGGIPLLLCAIKPIRDDPFSAPTSADARFVPAFDEKKKKKKKQREEEKEVATTFMRVDSVRMEIVKCRLIDRYARLIFWREGHTHAKLHIAYRNTRIMQLLYKHTLGLCHV